MVSSLKVLVEDTGSEHLALGKEHGLSLYVETPQSRFVFDCGASGLAWRNAPFMGVNLMQVEFAAISHAHYDHAGGFPSLLERVKVKKLYTGRGFWEEKFAQAEEGGKYTYLGAGVSGGEGGGVTKKERISPPFAKSGERCALFVIFLYSIRASR